MGSSLFPVPPFLSFFLYGLPPPQMGATCPAYPEHWQIGMGLDSSIFVRKS